MVTGSPLLVTSIKEKSAKVFQLRLPISSRLFIRTKQFDEMGTGPSMCLFSEADEKKMLGPSLSSGIYSQAEFSHCRHKKTQCPLTGNHSKGTQI